MKKGISIYSSRPICFSRFQSRAIARFRSLGNAIEYTFRYRFTVHDIVVVCLLSFLTVGSVFAQEGQVIGRVLDSRVQKGIEGVSVWVEENNRLVTTDQSGHFSITELKFGQYQLVFFAEGFTTITKEVILNQPKQNLDILMDSLALTIEAIEVEAERRQYYGLRRLRNVEGMAIYAAKKSEVIDLDKVTGNLAANNAREVYKGIAGLNIWENDGVGLQLAIGARGLNPNRTSNFNTRQNGYDISADALGYPESYYTPPTQALRRIEIVRGAASLQYGTQFGGLLNFVFKKGPKDKPFEFVTENTVGAFGFINSFNSIGGTKGKVNYYGFYQRKQGDGWRPNSKFDQNTAFANINFKLSPKLSLGLEYTYMDYLAQQAGGLQDFEFEQNPRQSKRARNWFKVNWNLAALNFDYRISDRTKLNSRSFLLLAERDALGELGPINRPDPLRERDLIVGQYRNFGNETRLIHRYDLADQFSTFLVGFRYYQGHTDNRQGNAGDGAGPDFSFLNPDDLERSEYEFPSRNVSLFAENLFNLNNRLSITPGIRLEYIRTASDGYYKERVFSGGQVIFEQKFEDAKVNERAFALVGLGMGYRLKEEVELYANFSQNYRAINFSDLAVVNPNLVVDSLLRDEHGFNADIGLRGQALDGRIRFDWSLFYLHYRDRIGISEIVVPDPAVVERPVAFRTNIGDARIIGLESYVEADLWRLAFGTEQRISLLAFANLGLLDGKYLSGRSEFVNNEVELIPPVSIKTGLTFQAGNLRASYQYTYVHEHYTDATNAEFVVNATRGIIPSYQVMDVSVSYELGRFRFQAGINNLLNEAYFTRRATGYPGPGIIPAEGRRFYGGVRITL